MIGIALALLSAATSAISVVLVRRHSAQSSTLNISLIISTVGLLLLWPIALFLTDFTELNLLSLAVFAMSGILTPGLVRLLYYQGMKKLGTPVNSSLYATYPIYTSLLAHVFLMEIFTSVNWLGILLVFFAALSVEWSAREITLDGFRQRRNLLFPIIGGLTLGIGSLLRKFALELFNAPVFGVAVAYTFSLIPYLLIFLSSNGTRKDLAIKRDLRLFWAAGIGQAVTWVLAFYALSFEQVSIVTPLISTEPVFVAIFAFLYLRKIEQLSPKLFASIILTVAGVILVTANI
ncbi:MAG: DMT family transporter [Candidatus Bathyarchaeota archaeon]|nr:DMT family transporter [Candidatus Bathyarchaeota archaeon]